MRVMITVKEDHFRIRRTVINTYCRHDLPFLLRLTRFCLKVRACTLSLLRGIMTD